MKAVASVAWFLGGFALFQWAFDHVASPFQGAEKVSARFAYFAAHKDDYDVVFVGSSRVMNQISPRRFDREMAAAGRPVRAFNLGYAGMYLPECSFLVTQILALHPAKLRTLVLELSDPAPRREETEDISDREIYWHRPLPTLLACAALLTDATSPFTPAERLSQAGRQLNLLARCVLHVGQGPEWLAGWRRHRAKPATSAAVLGPEGDGFFPLKSRLGGGADGGVKEGGGPRELAGFRAATERLRQGSPERTPGAAGLPASAVGYGERVLRQFLGGQVAAWRRWGIAPIFYIAPGIAREQMFLDLRADGTLPVLLAYNDPQAHPELYDPAVRADRYHLNAAGADLLTRKLARALSAPVTR